LRHLGNAGWRWQSYAVVTYTKRASSIVRATHAVSVVTVTTVLIWARG
jgi:hypothetical protein